MPGFDGQGPMWGGGPGAGWGMGPCGAGMGFGCGFGRGSGRGGFGRRRGAGMRRGSGWGGFWGQPQEMTKKDETEMLHEEQKALREELAEVVKALKDLQGKK